MVFVLVFLKTLHLFFVTLLLPGIWLQFWQSSFYRYLRWLITFVLATGLLLVHPAHYTFKTPWIVHAIILTILLVGLTHIPYFQSFMNNQPKHFKQKILRILWACTFFTILVLIAYEAIIKAVFTFEIN
jgi:hypothetical protein